MRRVAAAAVSILIMILMLLPAAYVSAQPYIDASRGGTITMYARDPQTHEPLSGVTFRIYPVAYYDESAGNFVLTDDFKNSGISLVDLDASDTPEIAQTLRKYAEENNIKYAKTTTDEKGYAYYHCEKLGWYLVVQQKDSAWQYEEITPFLVSVPMMNVDSTQWVYDIYVKLKIEGGDVPTSRPTTTGKPGEETTSHSADDETTTNKDSSTTKHNEKLPQTGLLKWPIPVCALAGAVIFGLGWGEYHLKKDEYDEE